VVAAHLDPTVVRLFSSNKTGDLLPLNPSALAFLSSLPDSTMPHGATEATGEQNGERWHYRGPPRRRARPPMGGCSTVEQLLGGLYPRTPTSVRGTSTSSAHQRAVAQALSTRCVDPRPAVVHEVSDSTLPVLLRFN
jgi:hypothetical protein